MAIRQELTDENFFYAFNNHVVLRNARLKGSGEVPPYAKFVASLVKDMGSQTLDIHHAATGIAGEAGELLDCSKKHWVYGKPLDTENMVEELGDLMFYVTAMLLLIDVPMATILQKNVEKLEKRYPQEYSDAAAIARADKQE